MKVCYCEDCHKKFYGNSCLQIYYSESNMLITQDRHSTYELCNDCAMKRKAEWDALRLNNLKTNFADDFKQTIEKKEILIKLPKIKKVKKSKKTIFDKMLETPVYKSKSRKKMLKGLVRCDTK